MDDAKIVGELVGLFVGMFVWLAVLARLALEMLHPANGSVDLMVRHGMAVIAYVTITTILYGSWLAVVANLVN
jgi:hypothetical protein